MCIHGAYCDARIFNYLGNKLASRGIDVFAVDLPGHGKSAGPKGDLDFDSSLEAIKKVVEEIKKNSKVILLGHSLGCTFALWYAHNFRDSADGLILMAPYVRVPNVKKRSAAEPTMSYLFYLMLRRILTPKKLVKFTDALPAVMEKGGYEISRMLQDPDLNFHYSYRFIMDVIAARNNKVDELSDIDAPILLLHGKNDELVFPEVSGEFYKLINSKKKKIQFFDCDHWFCHAIFYEQSKYSEESRQQIVESIEDWMHTLETRSIEKDK